MTNTLLLVLIARLGLAPIPITSPTCLAADSNSTHYVDRISAVVTGTDSTSQLMRTRLQLPQLSASSITLVTDSRTCTSASSALDAAQGATNASRRLYVFKLGNTRFGVVDLNNYPPTSDATDASISIWFFDNKWHYLSAMTT